MTKFYSRKEAIAFWLTISCIVFSIVYSIYNCFAVGFFYYFLSAMTSWILIYYLRRLSKMFPPEDSQLALLLFVLMFFEWLLFQGLNFLTAKIVLTAVGALNIIFIWLLYSLAKKFEL